MKRDFPAKNISRIIADEFHPFTLPLFADRLETIPPPPHPPKTLRDNLVMTGEVTPLADLPTEFFHSLIVSRFDALEPLEKTVLKAATGE